MASIAMHVLDKHLRGVRFEADTIITIVDGGVLDSDMGGAVDVPSVGVLCCIVRLAEARDVDVGEFDVRRIGNPVVILRAVPQVQVIEGPAMQADDADQDGTKDVDVLRVQVIPYLTVAVESAAAIYIDIRPSDLEERGGVLEDLLEGMCLPIVSVVREEHIAPNVEINVLQKCQIECCSNEVVGRGVEYNMTARIAFVYCREDVWRVVMYKVIVRLHMTGLATGPIC